MYQEMTMHPNYIYENREIDNLITTVLRSDVKPNIDSEHMFKITVFKILSLLKESRLSGDYVKDSYWLEIAIKILKRLLIILQKKRNLT